MLIAIATNVEIYVIPICTALQSLNKNINSKIKSRNYKNFQISPLFSIEYLIALMIE